MRPSKLFLTGAMAAASMPLAAQQSIPVRSLAPVAAKSAEPFGAVLSVRALPGGNLLVNDAGRRQVVMLDSTLTKRTVVIDSAAAINGYGPRGAPMIPYLGDSTLFVDGPSSSLLVLDPNGKVSRVMAAPRPQDLRFMASGNGFVDNKGRLIYRGGNIMNMNMGGPAGGGRGAAGAPAINQPPDSAAIVRADFETRGVDTIGHINQSRGQKLEMVPSPNGGIGGIKTTINPLPSIDDWTVNSDGSVAMVRGHDYHIDWVNSDGTTSSTGKLPFEWKRLTDADKQEVIDSAKAQQERAAAKMKDAMKNGTAFGGADADIAKRAMEASAGAGGGGGGGGDRQMVMVMKSDAVSSAGGAAGGAPMVMGNVNGQSMTAQVEYVPLNEMPDYYPPIRQGAVRADMDGNVWILPTTANQLPGVGLVYDVVNRKGELTERVAVPAGKSIAGFGKNGVVYLMTGDVTNGFTLERTRIVMDGKKVTQ